MRIALWGLTAAWLVGAAVQLIDREHAPPPAGFLASAGGISLVLLFLGLYLAEIRTEVDGESGRVRVVGRKFPLRRWSAERTLSEVAEVKVTEYRGMSRSFRVYLRFADDSAVLVLSPVTVDPRRIDDWVGQLRGAIEAARTT